MHAKDVRFVGMYVHGREMVNGPTILWDGGNPPSRVVGWEESRHDGRVVVVGWMAGGGSIEWTLDPRRGWNAVRIAGYRGAPKDGELLCLTTCELRDFDGVWLPAVTVYSFPHDDQVRVEIEAVRRDPQSARPRFTGEDLGLEPGFSIAPQDGDPPRGGFRWSGTKLVSAQEWRDMVRSGARPGPTLQRELRGEMSPLYTQEERELLRGFWRDNRQRVAGQHEEMWEAYVRRFITQYNLDDDQRQKAALILEECQAKARQYIESRKDEIEANLTVDDADGDSRAGRTRLAAVLRPVQDIFENELKPRLNRLPTRAQSAAQLGATTAPATQPATPGAQPGTED